MIIEKIGLCAVLEQLSEECNELAKATLKMSRKIRDENPTPKTYSEIRNELNEEIADVQNVLSILYEESDLLDKDSINETIDYKRDRWNRRLDDEFLTEDEGLFKEMLVKYNSNNRDQSNE